MKKIDFSKYPNVQFGQNVEIHGLNIVIRDGVKIGNNVRIECETIEIGFDSIIEFDTIIKSITATKMQKFTVGDNCLIGFKNQILVPEFELMDYSQLHNSCLCSGYKPLLIGNNCWIGQGAILNSFENLTLKNNVRMGGSQIWTHVASGELLEGSNFFGAKPVTLEDDVWLMGFGHLITPGVTIRQGSVIMAGSTITKSTEPFKTYSGIPAKDITEKLPAWTKKTLEQKFILMKNFVDEFKIAYEKWSEQVIILSTNNTTESDMIEFVESEGGTKLILFDNIDLNKFKNSKQSLFDLNTKKYIKQRTAIEIDFIKFNLGYRARFIPHSIT